MKLVHEFAEAFPVDILNWSFTSSGSYHGYDVSCFVNIWPVSWRPHCFGCLHQLFFYTDGINLCCHAYGFRELEVCICLLSVQLFLYVAYLQLHIAIIRNTVVYPIFQLNSHITFVLQCLQVRDFKILHWWSLSTTKACTLSDSKQNYLPTQTLHCVWCDTRHPFCTHHR